MSTDGLLMYIRKKSGPNKMDPCSVPAFTGNNSDVWLFSTTLWNLFVKKLLINRNTQWLKIQNKSLMPHFIKTLLWHIQKTPPQDSRVGYASKAESEYISQTMDNSWFTQELLVHKPDWSAVRVICVLQDIHQQN